MILNAIVYLGSSLFSKAVPFLLLPLLTRYLTPAEYGLVAIFQLALTFNQSLYGCLNTNISRKYFRLNQQLFSQYMSAIYLVLLIIFVVTQIITIVYFYSGGPDFGLSKGWLLAMPIIAAMSMANLLNLTLLRTQSRPFKYALWEMSYAAIGLALSIFLVIALTMSWNGRVIGISIPLIVYGMAGTIAIWRGGLMATPVSTADCREIFRVSLPLIPHALSSVIIASSDLLFIRALLEENEVGIYSVGYQFGMVIFLFTDAFLKAWQPWFYKKMSDPVRESKLSVTLGIRRYIVLLIIGAGIYGVIASMVLPYLVDARYVEAKNLILPIAMSYVFYGMYQIMYPFLVNEGKTGYMAMITPIAAFINIVLNYLLIPVYGMMGAIVATAFAFFIMFVLTFYSAIKMVRMPWFSNVLSE